MRGDARRTARLRPGSALVVAVLILAAVLSACSSNNDSGSGSKTTSAPATSSSLKPECQKVVTTARTLVSDIPGLATGSTSAATMRSDVQDLQTAIDDAQATVGPQVKSDLKDAKSALNRMIDALQARPLQLSAVRSAGSDLLTSAQNAAKACSQS